MTESIKYLSKDDFIAFVDGIGNFTYNTSSNLAEILPGNIHKMTIIKKIVDKFERCECDSVAIIEEGLELHVHVSKNGVLTFLFNFMFSNECRK